MKSSMRALLVVGGIAILGVVLYIFSSPNNDSTLNTQVNQSMEQVSAEEEFNDSEEDVNSNTYTLNQVSTHNTRNDCWTVINGNVYDLTSFISRHAGGDNILSACGIDATSYFSGEQSGQLGGTNDHTSSNSALNELSRLQIGTLNAN